MQFGNILLKNKFLWQTRYRSNKPSLKKSFTKPDTMESYPSVNKYELTKVKFFKAEEVRTAQLVAFTWEV